MLTKSTLDRSIAAKIIILILSIAILAVFIPRESSLNIYYELNKPWRLNALFADFDFPIQKAEEAIETEFDSIMRNFVPYYTINDDVEQQQLSQIESLLTDSGYSSSKSRILPQVKALYDTGIIDDEDYNTLREGSGQIRIEANNKANLSPLDSIYSPFTAYKKLLANNDDIKVILRKLNISNYLIANLCYDSLKNESVKKDKLSEIAIEGGGVLRGQKIIDKGDIVDRTKYDILMSYEKESNKRNESSFHNEGILSGQILFISILLLMLFVYLWFFKKEHLEMIKNLLLVFSLIVVITVLCYQMVSHHFFNVYVIPFAIVPIFIRIFLDSRTAFISHIIMVLLCAVPLHSSFEFIVIQTVAGIIAIVSLQDLSSRSQLIKVAVLVTLGSAMINLAMDLIEFGDITKFDRSMYFHFIENGVLMLFAYPLLWGIEKLFGFTSNVTLVELSNTNNTLLRKLSEVAPGTFQHSIQVGNLAAEVANKIGAKSQMVRTGALYHDIGKMMNPAFFTENQSGINPHDNLSAIDSAQIIISHVTDGVKIAEKNNLPKVIRDFIKTHHGQGKCKFFYNKYLNEHPDDDIDTLVFTYPGTNPFTREQAILMMVDTVEAASRSLTEYTEKSISALVDRLIDTQLEEGFFRDCPITFHDIAITKTVLTERLKSVYHTRIRYPETKTTTNS